MTIKKDDPNLAKAPCGHVHYLRRALAEAIGCDMEDFDKQAAGNGISLNLDKAWPIADAVYDGFKDDMDMLIDAEGPVVDTLDRYFRLEVLMRVADRLEQTDKKCASIMRILVLDALATMLPQEMGLVALLDASPPKGPDRLN